MLRRSLSASFIKSVRNGRAYASASSSKSLATSVPQEEKKSSAEFINFRDPKVSFAAISTPELLRSSIVFRLCSYPFIVKNNKKLMNFGRKVLGPTLFKKLMKSTFYGQFVAGENQEEIQSLIQRYRRYNVKSILDYGFEKEDMESDAVKGLKGTLYESLEVSDTSSKAINGEYQQSIESGGRQKDVFSSQTCLYSPEGQYDVNLKILMECIDASARAIAKEGFIAIKLSALGRPQSLFQFSDFLVQMERFFNLLTDATRAGHHIPPSIASTDMENVQKRLEIMGVEIGCDQPAECLTILDRSGDGIGDLLDWNNLIQFERNLAELFKVNNIEIGRTEQLVSTLTKHGVEELRNMVHRIDHLAQYAKSKGVRLMIDAEHSHFQPAIRRISMEMMHRFNKECCTIFNTYQCYLKNALKELRQDLLIAEKNDFFFGAKLVRGAYIEQERKRAKELGYPDPTNPTYEATTMMYQECFEESLSALERTPRGRVLIMVATHNEDSVKYALKRMKERGVKPEHHLICFGQLLGMCDHVSFPLGNAGYSVYKYVPYGTVEEVLPYLSRRAYENQSVLSNVSVERQMRWNELKRRVRAGQFFTKP
nr:proline oxidase [Hymenolepis microstoma]